MPLAAAPRPLTGFGGRVHAALVVTLALPGGASGGERVTARGWGMKPGGTKARAKHAALTEPRGTPGGGRKLARARAGMHGSPCTPPACSLVYEKIERRDQLGKLRNVILEAYREAQRVRRFCKPPVVCQLVGGGQAQAVGVAVAVDCRARCAGEWGWGGGGGGVGKDCPCALILRAHQRQGRREYAVRVMRAAGPLIR